MGSDEAGAASALTRLGSEPCGARCVCDDCGLPSRAPPMARMAALRRLNPGPARCECRGVLGPHRTAREPISSEAGCGLLAGFATIFAAEVCRHIRRRRPALLVAERQRCKAALLLVTPVAARTACTASVQRTHGAESRRHVLHTSAQRRAHERRKRALE